MTADTWRSHFHIFEHTTYVNSCSCGALSREVEAAYHAYLASRHAHGAAWQTWCEKNEVVRRQFADLVNAAPEEIAVTTSASQSLNTLVSALKPEAGRNRVVISDYEFPTVGQIWHAQTGRGFEIATAREGDDGIPLEEFDRLIDERTLAVSIAHVCYRNGAMNDVERIVEMAHARGAMVILDAYQALGAVPIDVRALGVDALIGGALKYLLASAGLGFLYIRNNYLSKLDPYATGWFAQADIFAMDMHKHEPAPDARRFESGTPPVPSIYAAEAGLGIINRIGMTAIRDHVRGLTARLKDGVRDMGGRLATPDDPERHGAMIAVKTTDDHAMVARLAERKLITSCRDGNVRISPHLYNTVADIDAVLEGLAANRDLLA